MRSTFLISAALACAVAWPIDSARAMSFTDPAGDFEPTYIGPVNADLDILSGTLGFDPGILYLSSRMNGTIGGTTGSVYLWGVNRGAGTVPFGAPGVTPIFFDAVIRLGSNGSGFITYFPSGGAPTGMPLPAGVVSVVGDTISVALSRSLLPSTGFAFADYTYNHWSRSALGADNLIADVAPAGANLRATAVPEPGTWAMMILGLGMAGAARRSRLRAAFG